MPIKPACFAAPRSRAKVLRRNCLCGAAESIESVHSVGEPFLRRDIQFQNPDVGVEFAAPGQELFRFFFVADARLIDAEGEEAARGTGTFMRSRIPLTSLDGYSA